MEKVIQIKKVIDRKKYDENKTPTEILWDKYLEELKSRNSWKVNNIINLDNTLKIISYIDFYYKDKSELINFLWKTIKLENNLKEEILEYLIELGFNWIYEWYMEISWIDKNNIIKKLIKKWYIQFIEYLSILIIKNNFNEEEIIDSLNIFYNEKFKYLSLKEKLDLFKNHDWHYIINKLNHIIDKESLSNFTDILKLTPDEKEELEKEKIDKYYDEYNENIEYEKYLLSEDWFLLLSEITFTWNFSNTENKKRLENLLKEIWILNNWINIFKIDFIYINWKKQKFSLEPFNKNIDYDNWVFYDFDLFYKEVIQNIKTNKINLENGIDYTILISKIQWWKDNNPFLKNDKQEFKIAA